MKSIVLLRTLIVGFVLTSVSVLGQAFDEAARPLQTPAPSYPAELVPENIAAKVVLSVFIDAEGNVSEVKILKSTDERFNATTLETVKTVWKFTPATLGGKPVASKLNIPVRFEPRSS